MSASTFLFRPNWRSYVRALMAIARKDWKVYWRYPLNVLSHIFQPLIWLTPVFFMGRAFSVNGQPQGFAAYSGTLDFMSFILLGNVLGDFVSAVFWGMGFSLKNDMDAGVLESNWLAPMPRLYLLTGHTFANILTTALTSAATLLVAGLLFGFQVSGNVVAALGAALPMLLGLYGFGFAFAALVLIIKEANTLVDIGNFLVQILSGSNFPVQALPRWLLPFSLALPLTYGIDSVRGILMGTKTLLPIQQEIIILVAFMFIMVALGKKVFNALERRVRVRGTLGAH